MDYGEAADATRNLRFALDTNLMEPIKATRLGVNEGRAAWYSRQERRGRPPGRICAHCGCDTILSVYNRQRYCSVHVKSDYVPKDSRFRSA